MASLGGIGAARVLKPAVFRRLLQRVQSQYGGQLEPGDDITAPKLTLIYRGREFQLAPNPGNRHRLPWSSIKVVCSVKCQMEAVFKQEDLLGKFTRIFRFSKPIVWRDEEGVFFELVCKDKQLKKLILNDKRIMQLLEELSVGMVCFGFTQRHFVYLNNYTHLNASIDILARLADYVESSMR